MSSGQAQHPFVSPTTTSLLTDFTAGMAPGSGAVGLCVFAISPTLLPLHRLLYYLSLGLALLYPTPPPLIKGAFTYSLTTSAIAALYAIILGLPHPQDISSPQNLDVLPFWSILSSAAISFPMFLAWNRNVGNPSNPVRSVVRIWGLLNLFGTACAFVNLRQFHRLASFSSGMPSSNAEQCQALDARRTLRNIHHAQTMNLTLLASKAFHHVWKVTPPMTFLPLAIGALSCLITPPKRNVDAAALNGPEFTTSDDLLDNRLSRGFRLLATVYEPIRTLILWCSPAFWIVVLVLNEILLLQKRDNKLPATEEVYEVGQWGVWAGLALVVAAGLVDYVTGRRKPKAKFYLRNGEEGTVDYGGVGVEV